MLPILCFVRDDSQLSIQYSHKFPEHNFFGLFESMTPLLRTYISFIFIFIFQQILIESKRHHRQLQAPLPQKKNGPRKTAYEKNGDKIIHLKWGPEAGKMKVYPGPSAGFFSFHFSFPTSMDVQHLKIYTQKWHTSTLVFFTQAIFLQSLLQNLGDYSQNVSFRVILFRWFPHQSQSSPLK